jgi:putative ABC transport system permease protein
MRGILQDFRYAIRVLFKGRKWAIVAVIALALGIGLSTTIFSIFYNGVLRPFPYRDANRLTVISVYDVQHGNQGFRSVYHLDEVKAFRERNHTFDDIVGYAGWDFVYQRRGASEPLHGCALTPNGMAFWGVPPLLGRGLTEADSRPGAAPVVLLNYVFWKREFHKDKNVLGKTLMLSGQARTVVGVMPPRFGLFGADVYVPIAWNRPEPTPAEAMENQLPYYFFATGIRKKGVSLETAAEDLQAIANQLVALHKEDYPQHFRMETRPMSDVIVGDFKQTLILLIAAVVLLLLISSSNVASLLLAHASSRAKEIALRAALGAGRSRLMRQLFVESLILGLCGCAAGCVLAEAGIKVAVTLTPMMQIPGEADITLNLPVLAFAVGVSLLATFLAGMSPALFAGKKDLRTNLQSAGVNVNASQVGARMRSVLVVGQVTLSMLLLVFAGLMIRSFLAVTDANLGFRTDHLLTAEVHFPAQRYDSAQSKKEYFDQLLAGVARIPGVTNAAETLNMPTEGEPRSDVTIPGRPHEQHWFTAIEACSEGYFQTLGLQLLRGRLLSASDMASGARVAVVNRTLVEKYFGMEDPLGHQIKFNVMDRIPQLPHNAYFQIVGVVSDFRNFGPGEPTMPEAFLPYTFSGFGDRAIVVRTAVAPASLVDTIERVVASVDPDTVLEHPNSLDALLEQNVYAKPRFRLIAFGTCAAIGLALALIGLFGVMAYSVTLQTHEFGVRVALGAQGRDILALVLRRGLLLVGSGTALGLLVSFLSVHILKSQLWGISSFDPVAFVVAPIALLMTGLLACYLPARRATKVDPMIALRYE